MGFKCCVVGCNTNYVSTKTLEGSTKESVYKSVFSIPKHNDEYPEIRKTWIKRISRHKKDFNVDKAWVCGLHFKEEDFKLFNVKTGQPRKRPALHPWAVPIHFPSHPSYMQPKEDAPRPTTSATREASYQVRQKTVGDQEVNFLSFTRDALNYDDVPYTEYCMNIYSDLTFLLFVRGVKVSRKRFSDVLQKENSNDPKYPNHIGRLSEIENVLALLKNTEIQADEPLEQARQMLERVNLDELEDEKRSVTLFCKEQLKLVMNNPQARRYSSLLLGQCALWDRLSPKLYRHLYRCSYMVLPHPQNCRQKLSALNVTGGFTEVTRKYFQMRCAKLNPLERLVHLSMDEVHTSEALEFAAGHVYGETAGKLTCRLFATHIQSIAGKYNDLVCITPVHTTTAAFIDKEFTTVVKQLTDIGFTFVSISTDNHKSNQCWNSMLLNSSMSKGHSLEFPSPADPGNKELNITSVYDSTHIYKNIYYSLLNRKVLKFRNFPWVQGRSTPVRVMANGSSQHTVQLDHLRKIHNKDFQHPAKMGYKITDKVLNPSNIERQSVSLAAAATDATTTAALRFVAAEKGDPEYDDTADFLDAVRRWFTILNVKTKHADVRYRDPDRRRVLPNCPTSAANLDFIQEFGNFMKEAYEDPSVENKWKVTRDTSLATYYTSRNIRHLATNILAKYSDEPWGLQYLLLGKFQSDKLESHFGHLRKLAGSNYWTTVRNFMQGEAIIRKQNLLWYSGYDIAEVTREMSTARQFDKDADEVVVKFLYDSLISSIQHDGELVYELPNQAKAALGHISGYIGHKVIRMSKCNDCINVMVDKDGLELQTSFELEEESKCTEEFLLMTRTLNRGGLKRPTEIGVNLTVGACQVWRHIINDPVRRDKFFSSDSGLKVFQVVVKRFMYEYFEVGECSCDSGHPLVEYVLPMVTGTLFNCFGSNLARDAASTVHRGKKTSRYPSGEERRVRDTRKRQKLQGEKE